MHKPRKMARALFIVQRNTRQFRHILNSDKPFLNQSSKFTIENIRHTLNRDCTTAPVCSHTLYGCCHLTLRSISTLSEQRKRTCTKEDRILMSYAQQLLFGFI